MAFPTLTARNPTADGSTGGAATSGSTAATSHSVAYPATVNAGDLLTIYGRVAVAGAVAVTGGGWTILQDSSDASDDVAFWGYRDTLADGTEDGTSITVTHGNGKMAAVMEAWGGAADPAVQPPQASTVAIGTTTSVDPTACTPTGGAKDYAWIWFGSWDGEQTLSKTQPTNYTDGPDVSSGTGGVTATNVQLKVATRALNAASENPGSCGPLSTTPTGWTAWVIAVHPASGQIHQISANVDLVSDAQASAGLTLQASATVDFVADQTADVHYASYLAIIDTNAWVSTPDHADFAFTDGIDVRMYMALDAWHSAASSSHYMGQRGSASTASWVNSVHANGAPRLAVYEDGTNPKGVEATAAHPFTNGQAAWFRATVDFDNGSGQSVYNYYSSADGVNWTQIGAADLLLADTITLFASTNDVTIPGSPPPLAALLRRTGKVYYAEVRNGAGTVIANPDFRSAPPGATSVTDSTGKVWTLQGNALVAVRTVHQIPAGLGAAYTDAVAEHSADLTVTPSGTDHAISATVDAVSDVEATAGLVLPAQAAVDAIADQQAVVVLVQSVSATVDAVASQAVTATLQLPVAGTVSAVASHLATAALRYSVAGIVDAVASQDAALGLILAAVAAVDSVATQEATLRLTLPIAGTVDSVAEHEATLLVGGSGDISATLNAVADITAALTLTAGVSAVVDAVADQQVTVQLSLGAGASVDAVMDASAALQTVFSLLASVDAVADQSAEVTIIPFSTVYLQVTLGELVRRFEVLVLDRRYTAGDLGRRFTVGDLRR